MWEIKVITANCMILLFVSVSLVLLGLTIINRFLIHLSILIFGILFTIVYLCIRKKILSTTDDKAVDDDKKTVAKKIIKISTYLIPAMFYFFCILIIVWFWFFDGGAIWLRKSVTFFSVRFHNHYLRSTAIFIVPATYWITIKSIYLNTISYFKKKYHLDD